MNNGRIILLSFSLFLFIPKQFTAQNSLQLELTNTVPSAELKCGTVPTLADIDYINDLSQTYQKTEEIFLKNATLTNKAPIYMPIKAHIVRTNSGTGGLSISDLNNAISIMNGFYINANIQFYLCSGVNYIDNSTYYDFNSTDDEAAMISAHNVSNNINIYFVDKVKTNGVKVKGYTRFPGPDPSNNIIILENYFTINGHTLSHEMGHFFSLYHTHGFTSNGVSDELVDGSNCVFRGDQICDTPADPNLSGKVNASCIYTGTSVDANSQTYNPDPRNIMSYSTINCRSLFTPGQYARINSTAINSIYRNSYTCVPPSDDAGIKEILQPQNDVPFCDNTLSPEITLRNYSSSPLSSVTIKYQIDNGAINTYSWTGNLAGEQSVNITLPSIPSPGSSVFTFKVYTSNPNSNSDNNVTNDELTATTKNSVSANVISNGNLLLASASSLSYKWLDCDNNYAAIPGATNQQYFATRSGNYAVEVSKNKCIDTSACQNVSTTSLSENLFKDQIHIYPNPNKGKVNIELGNLSNVSIKVINVNGQTVHFEEKIDTDLYQFELYEATGVYFVEISSGSQKQKFKLLLKN